MLRVAYFVKFNTLNATRYTELTMQEILTRLKEAEKLTLELMERL